MNKRSFLLLIVAGLGAGTLYADNQVRDVQQQLKDQGFYYGEVDGNYGSETSAAIRRYQIRNGLQVTGTLTQETLGSMKINMGGQAGQSTAGAAPSRTAATPAPAAPKKNVVDSDREFLRKHGNAPNPPEQDQQPAPQPQPQSPPPGSSNVISPPVAMSSQPTEIAAAYASLFRRTPFENASIDVQQSILKNAQLRMAQERFYNGSVDGIPGPATERALFLYQDDADLPQTGRLDYETLRDMNLLPRRPVVAEPFYPPPYYARPRVYRGIWVH